MKLFVLSAITLSLTSAASREFVFEPLPSHPKCHAVSVVELTDGSLYAAWFAGEKEGSKDQAIFASRRTAGKWSKPRIVAETPAIPDFNPVLLANGNDVHLYFVRQETDSTAATTMWRQVSKDRGESWSKPVLAMQETGFWGRNAVLPLADRWLVPVSDVQNRGPRFLIFDRSAQKAHLSSLIKSERYLTQPAVAPYRSSLVAVLRERSKPDGHIWLSNSSDSGETWSTPHALEFPNPDSGITVLGIPGDRLLLVYNHAGARRTPLSIAVSSDGGKSWKRGPDLETEPGEYSYPTALLGRDGKVHVFYTWQRLRIVHVILDPSTLD